MSPRTASPIALIGLCLWAGPTLAAVSADEVWDAWRKAATAAGLSLTAATEVRGDATLRLNGLELAGGEGRATLAALTLTETADGDVEVVPTGEVRVTLPGDVAPTLILSQAALVLTVAEADGGLSHRILADSLTLAGAIPPLAPPADPADTRGSELNIALTDLDLTVTDTAGAARIFGLDLSAGLLAYDVSGADPVTGAEDRSSAEVDDIVIAGDLALAETRSILDIDSPADVADLLRDGWSLRLESRMGDQRGSERDANPMAPIDLTYTALPGSGSIVVNAQTISVVSAGEGMAGRLVAPGFAGGASEFTIGPLAIALGLPGPAVTGAGDWTFALTLADVVLGDGMWMTFDPEGVVDRGPMSLGLDFVWRMQWDMFAAIGSPTPIEPVPESLTLRDLSFAGAGLVARAGGAFRFVVPQGEGLEAIIPEGQGNLEVMGLNRLIENLITLGAMTRDDAMGARMAMGGFLKPDGEDRFTSEIEARADGQVFVNGARMK